MNMLALLACGVLAASASAQPAAKPATSAAAEASGTALTPAEKAAGWQYLFDGSSIANFRGYRNDKFPTQGWTIKDGSLYHAKGGGGGDIITTMQFQDFELECEFKCAEGANSGIMYRVAEKGDAPYFTGPEYQILDDAKHIDGTNTKHSVGALYDLIEPKLRDGGAKPASPAGEWHKARIRICKGLLQHFLNDRLVVETRIDTPQWKEMIEASKFKAWPGFGLEQQGHIAFQDHGDEVWYRNIKVRDLTRKMPGEVALLSGGDLDGWDFVVPDLAGKTPGPSSVWNLKDGVLTCSGTPSGYIRTKEKHDNYVLLVQWRFDPSKGAGNSGVLLRGQEPDKVWPKSIEAQLHSGNAGDFWCIDNFPMKADAARTKGRNTKKSHGNERAIGEWNEYEIICDAGTVSLRVNGEELNRATDCQVVPGFIALQSEGAEIQFREVRLSPIVK